MNRSFLSIAAFLFFISCTDLSVSEENALNGELPIDFKWEKYAEINRDVAKSQIAFDVNKQLPIYSGPDSAIQRNSDCGKIILGDLDFAGKIYEEFVGCPKSGWSVKEKCPGEYANNSVYSIANVTGEDTTWTCNIAGCSSDGWDKLAYGDLAEFNDRGCNTLDLSDPDDAIEYSMLGCAELLSSKLQIAIENGNYASIRQISMICRFVMPKPKSISDNKYLDSAKAYLDKFTYDSILVKQHYFIVGRSEGRPYKYCDGEPVDKTKERNPEMALALGNPSSMQFVYDYSQHLFCLDTKEWRIYKVQEKK
jgi:hypothetical protein